MDKQEVLDANEVIGSVIKACASGKHVVVVQSNDRKDVCRSALAKTIFSELNDQDSTRNCLMFVDGLNEEQLCTAVNMFYTVDDGVLVFTDHTNDISSLLSRIRNALLITGMCEREIDNRVRAMLDIVIHLQDGKIDSYTNFARIWRSGIIKDTPVKWMGSCFVIQLDNYSYEIKNDTVQIWNDEMKELDSIFTGMEIHFQLGKEEFFVETKEGIYNYSVKGTQGNLLLLWLPPASEKPLIVLVKTSKNRKDLLELLEKQ